MLKLYIKLGRIDIGLPGVSDGKGSACKVGDLDSVPGLRRSPGEGNGNPTCSSIYFLMILIGTSLMTSDVEHLSIH